MKWLLIVSFLALTGCDNPWRESTFTAYSCDRNGCAKLLTFANVYGCFAFKGQVINLHIKLRKEKPAKVLFCFDDKRQLPEFPSL